MSREEMDALGWDELDVLLVSGDAYVDHPTFGAALLGRWLVAHGYRVGVVPQPDWRSPGDVARLGRPRLLAGVTAGALDSMLAHQTAFRRRRTDDAYTPGGRAGARPDRATIVYTNLVRQAFPGLPVVLGGIEASLRRVTHFDFWTNKLRRSLLLDAKADAIIYGMAELALLEVLTRLAESGDAPPARAILGVPGTAVMGRLADLPPAAEVVTLPSHEAIAADPRELVVATLALERQVHQGRAWAAQEVAGRALLLAPPARPLTTPELDQLYGLPFSRRVHPSHRDEVPGLATVLHSVTSHRGCGGGCSFCSLALHQGRLVQSRSRESLLTEITTLTAQDHWRGSISDLGGPSANMWGARCLGSRDTCRRASCLTPQICPQFSVDQEALIALLDQAAALSGVKHLRVASGVRFDLALTSPAYTRALVERYVGGQLKIAPEHLSPGVLKLMRKPKPEVFERFVKAFQELSRAAGKEQYLVPYLLSAFPGCTDEDMAGLAAWLRQKGWRPQQVQCFVPTPGTVATAMYAAGVDPALHPIPVPHTDAERRRQHGILMGG
ncbi:MAG: YgiQ family radical SAM protein [Deltaproteobacteria bacterium]|nr:YgiQ family radical SAM protein [Deltaproteobacteria bacterium]MCB2186308.1 YgiQ family radical SAM protein [Deltaproteobacteria bacterium]